jgi:hypothetical protein
MGDPATYTTPEYDQPLGRTNPGQKLCKELSRSTFAFFGE